MQKDEIKEIIEFLKPIENRTCATLGNAKCKLLLDYITNLQTIEREYSAILSENAELENKIINLKEQLHQASLDIQELTERDIWCPTNCEKLTNLQQEKDKYFEDGLILSQELTNLQVENKTLKRWYRLSKSRIDKAINYINETNEIILSNGYIKNLLNILQGEDNV